MEPVGTTLIIPFLVDLFREELSGVSYVSTNDQLADMLTKPLLREKFQQMISKLGVSDSVSSLRRHVKDN